MGLGKWIRILAIVLPHERRIRSQLAGCFGLRLGLPKFGLNRL